MDERFGGVDWPGLLRHLEAAYPEEGCGVILGGAAGARYVPMANVYDAFHQRDPAAFPRSARTAYLFDPRAWLALNRAAMEGGEIVLCICHSHVDLGADFSAEDRAMAAPGGQPLLPGVSYLVVAVRGGRAGSARHFTWEAGEFVEIPGPFHPPSQSTGTWSANPGPRRL